MASEEERDWVDRVLARDAMWEPPTGFAEHMAVRAVALLEPARVSSRERHPLAPIAFPWQAIRRACESVVANTAGAAWVIRQYWNLVRST
jgi:hypothetical protein